MISRLLIAICSVALLLGCNNSTEGKDEPQVLNIAHLVSLCHDDHYRIVEECRLRCVVVANDLYGELYKSIIVGDETGTLEINVDVRNYDECFPLYGEVDIYCCGLMLARVGRRIEMGAAPTGEYPLSNIEEAVVDRYIRRTGHRGTYAPTTKQIAEISPLDIGEIVTIEDVRIEEAESGMFWCDFVDGEAISTLRTLVDKRGMTLPLRTISTCLYAGERMPQNEISVTGMVDYSDDRYFLRILNKWITQ